MAEVVITGTITTTDISDIYATHDAIYGKGGLRSVADYLEREAISDERRTEGMIVFTVATNEYWKLLQAPWSYTSLDWEPFTMGANPDNVTIITNTAGELVALPQQNEWGIKNHLVPTDVINVSLNYQYLVYGDLTVEGIMNNNGEVVIINGALILQGLGEFNNIGLGLLKLVNLATGTSMNAIVKTFSTTAGVPLNINHGLGTKDFTFNVREGNNVIEVDLVHVDDNNVTITTTANTTSANIIFQSKLI